MTRHVDQTDRKGLTSFRSAPRIARLCITIDSHASPCGLPVARDRLRSRARPFASTVLCAVLRICTRSALDALEWVDGHPSGRQLVGRWSRRRPDRPDTSRNSLRATWGHVALGA